MKKIILYILLPFSILAAALFFILGENNNYILPSKYIRSNTLAVVHLPNIKTTVKSLNNKSVFQHLLQFEGLKKLKTVIEANKGIIKSNLEASLSICIIEGGELLIILDEGKEAEKTLQLSNFGKENNYYVSTIDGTKWFFKRKNNLVFCSSKPELLKTLSDKDKLTLEDKVSWDKSFLYINQENKELQKIFESEKSIDQLISSAKILIPLVNYDLNLDDEHASLTSFNNNLVDIKTYDKVIKGQTPEDFSTQEYVSENTVALKSLYLSEGQIFQLRIEEYLKNKLPNLSFPTESEALNSFYSSLDKAFINEVFHITDKNRLNKIVTIISEEIEGTYSSFKELAKKGGEVSSFKGVDIVKAKTNALVHQLFGDFYTAYNDYYYCQYNDAVVISTDLDGLKQYLTDLIKNNTWAVSLERSKWIEEELTPYNLSFFMNLSGFKSSVKEYPYIYSFFNKNKLQISGFEWLRLQLSAEQNGIFSLASISLGDNINQSSLTLEEDLVVVEEEPNTSVITEKAIGKKLKSFGNKLISKPIPVKNYINGKTDFAIVDKSNILHLITSEGKEKWSFQLDGALKSKLFQLDVFKNQKLQLTFATENKVYCLDRLGRTVENFPIQLPNKQKISYYNLIDYDKSKNYRLAIGSNKSIWLYNVEGKSLDGWSPLKLKADLISNISHVRIEQKDLLMALTSDGKINALKRRGEFYKGFPVATGKELTSNIRFQKNKKFDKSSFKIISKKGVVANYNFYGKALGSEKLPGLVGTKKIIENNGGDNSMYLAEIEDKVLIFNDQMKQVFTKPITESVVNFQSYKLSNQDVFVLGKASGTEIVTKSNKVIIEKLETDQPITLYYSPSKKTGTIFYISENIVKKIKFSI